VQAGGSRLLPLLLRFWAQHFCRIHNQDNNEIVDSFFPPLEVLRHFPLLF
jgi:hypothetical protein